MSKLRNDDGTVAVLMAILTPVLLGMLALAFGTLALSGGERELQRAATASALATASQLSLLEAGDLDQLLAGADLPVRLAPLLCELAESNVGRSPLLAGFARGAGECLGDPMDAPARVRAAAALGTLGVTVAELKALLGLGPLPAPVGVAGLVPAVAAPYVRVDAHAIVQGPLTTLLGADPDGSEMDVTALARRRFKNAVVLPGDRLFCETVVGVWVPLLGSVDVTVSGTLNDLVDIAHGETSLLDPALDLLVAALVPDALRPLVDGGVGALLGSCTLNDPLPYGSELVNVALDEVGGNATLADLLAPSGVTPACLTGTLKMELNDVFDPLDEDDAAPTIDDVIAAAALGGEDVLAVVTGVAAATGVPILDVVPVAAAALRDGDLTPVLSARGVFRASLLQERPFDAPTTPLPC